VSPGSFTTWRRGRVPIGNELLEGWVSAHWGIVYFAPHDWRIYALDGTPLARRENLRDAKRYVAGLTVPLFAEERA
jgi:hypothetical protein